MLASYKLENGTLVLAAANPPSQGQILTRILVGLPHVANTREKHLTLVAHPRDAICVTNHFLWKDGKGIFDIGTRHLRSILLESKPISHVSLDWWGQLTTKPVDAQQISKII